MIDTKTQPEVVSPQPTKSPESQAQDFIKEYQALCEKHNMQIVIVPQYKARDDGTFSTILVTSVERLPKKED